MAYVYLAAIIAAGIAAALRRSQWPVPCILVPMAGTTAALALTPKAYQTPQWLETAWAPTDAVALAVSAVALIAALLEETQHPRHYLRFGVARIPVAIVGAIWLFDPHTNSLAIYYAFRARFWEAMALAWFIAWANTGWGARMSRDGILCLWICMLRGIASSFAPSEGGQFAFRVAASVALLSWSLGFPRRRQFE